jgi:predicted extracellular nuclease
MQKSSSKITAICDIQGSGLWSEYAGQEVTVRGVVTAVDRHGFFIQSTKPGPNPLESDAIFVFSRKWPAPPRALLEVSGQVVDYIKVDNGKPMTQIKLDNVRLLKRRGPEIQPFELTADNVPADTTELATFLNGLEGMLVSIEAGQTFIAPSNPFGDYVVILDKDASPPDVVRTEQGGVLLDHQNPLRWYPGFRIKDYKIAPRVNVGAKLRSRITGPLKYRVESYQIAANHPIEVEPNHYSLTATRLEPTPGFLTIMTLNVFNLDMHVESEDKVKNPRLDVDDDWGDGRFHTLAQAVVLQAKCPDIIAVQEIQDNDGAEISTVVDATSTYKGLIKVVGQLSDIEYRWVDIAPGLGTDGGQPGGSIRNGYLYNPDRVTLVDGSVRSVGLESAAFAGSRKPLVAHFIEKESAGELACINVHLASKRHQHSIFAPAKPSFDPRLPVRVEQAELIREDLLATREKGHLYYATGDFNDTQDSETLVALLGDESENLVNRLPPEERYDYNHRGKLQVLMHGIVPKSLARDRVEYEIIHGNELIGVKPGAPSDKPSDHAYVIAKIRMA